MKCVFLAGFDTGITVGHQVFEITALKTLRIGELGFPNSSEMLYRRYMISARCWPAYWEVVSGVDNAAMTFNSPIPGR